RAVCLFFQAEDGIRGFHVTGVQTCALPIYLQLFTETGLHDSEGKTSPGRPGIIDVGTGSGCIALALKKTLPRATVYAVDVSGDEIGRASCRERREMCAGARCARRRRGKPVR